MGGGTEGKGVSLRVVKEEEGAPWGLERGVAGQTGRFESVPESGAEDATLKCFLKHKGQKSENEKMRV